uniref:DUF4827 domain-containing protein n=5 Tax=unclassified Prevotella TaxID=2638335 RepID=A0AB33JM72_9BACT
MKKFTFLFFALVGVIIFASCRDHESYADKKKKERTAISQFIAKHKINLITESEFFKDTTTDVSKNEYVLLESSGIYLQIERKGTGSLIRPGETANVLCRFTETNLMTDSVILSNNVLFYSMIPDRITVRNTSGTYSGVFDSGNSVMYTAYGSTSVPTGWMSVFPYIKIGRQTRDNEEIAKVRIIVPSDKGTLSASRSVYPSLFELTFQRDI